MARRRRFRKPIFPGFWSVTAALLLIGCIGGLFWMLGKSTQLTRVTPPTAAAKGK